MTPLNCPRLVERLSVLVELMNDPDITGKSKARVTELWVFWQTLWEVHSRLVVMPRYARFLQQ